MASIYVSYNQRDRSIAERVVDGFRSRGHTVLWDVDLLSAGLDYRVVLAQALRDCPVVVSILTNNSVSASYPMSELGAARILGKVLIPLIFDDIDYPNVVQDLYCVRVSESNLDQVLDRVHSNIARFAENKKVFIVHGQNEAKKFELKDFLAKLALDLSFFTNKTTWEKRLLRNSSITRPNVHSPSSCSHRMIKRPQQTRRPMLNGEHDKM